MLLVPAVVASCASAGCAPAQLSSGAPWCGMQAKRAQVRKAGANQGRFFFACAKPWRGGRGNQCKFFQGDDDST